MTNAKVTRIPTAIKPDENYIDDPKIVKIAMLSLILTERLSLLSKLMSMMSLIISSFAESSSIYSY